MDIIRRVKEAESWEYTFIGWDFRRRMASDYLLRKKGPKFKGWAFSLCINFKVFALYWQISTPNYD